MGKLCIIIREEVVALPLFTLHIAQDKPRAVSDERLAKAPNFAEQTKQRPLPFNISRRKTKPLFK